MAILVVEDETDLSELLSYILRRAGHDVLLAFDGDSAIRVWKEKDPELVLLDVGLPLRSGWEVCQTIRRESSTPIMIVSGHDSEDDIVKGLDLGAYDYVTKPFSPRLLQARIRALLTQSQRSEPRSRDDSCLTVGDLTVEKDWRTISKGDQSLRLTRIENKVLHQLVLADRQVVYHSDLIERVWGYSGEDSSSLVKGHIRSLRLKLNRIGSAAEIRIIPGVGYMFASAAE